MNITELKELAEKATPGPWHWDSDPVKGDPLGRNRFRVVALGRTITQCYYSSGDEMAQTEASYIAAANPAAILELIAQLEDAQGEIRALRATEVGLIERVKELEEFASKVERQFWDATHPHSVESTLRDAARALLEKKE